MLLTKLSQGQAPRCSYTSHFSGFFVRLPLSNTAGIEERPEHQCQLVFRTGCDLKNICWLCRIMYHLHWINYVLDVSTEMNMPLELIIIVLYNVIHHALFVS
jgi:hypothetical protein